MGGGASIEQVPPKAGWELTQDVIPGYTPGQKYWVSNTCEHRPIVYAKSGPGSKEEAPPITFIELFKKAADKNKDQTAFLIEPLTDILYDTKNPSEKPPPSLERESWKQWTYGEYYEECRCASKAMLALGGKRFHGTCIYGMNSPWWIMAATSSILGGLLPAGMYPTDTLEQIEYKTQYADASFAFVGEKKHFDTYAKMIDACPKLIAIICWGYKPTSNELKRKDSSTVQVFTWDALIEKGKSESDTALDASISSCQPEECCAIVFTSGTTGKPKAVMLSHDNITFQAGAVIKLITGFGDDIKSPDRILSYLPLSHVAGLLMDIVAPLSVSALKPGTVETYFARPYDLKAGSLGERLKFVKPTAFLGVPRVWEKVADKIRAVGAKTKGIKKKVAKFAKAKGLEYETNRQVGGSGVRPAYHKKMDKLILTKIKKKLGLQECKLALTGAAPMPKEVQTYFGSLGISINDLYGMTECAGVTTGNNETTHMWGTVGQATPGVEVRVLKVDDTDVNKSTEAPKAQNGFAPTEAEQGEICYRGRHIMLGYYANPSLGAEHVAEIEKKNAETIDDKGFLHSGDKGCCNQANMFHITGRYKELIIGAGGENIAPVPVEDAIKNAAPGISNFIMIGNQRKFNTALVTLKAVGASGEQPGGDDLDPSVLHIGSEEVTKVSQAMEDPKWIEHIRQAITKVNNDPTVCISNVWKVGKFTILPRDLSVATEEFTPTLKTKRSYVDKKYEKVIDAMYAPQDSDYVKCPPTEVAMIVDNVQKVTSTPQ